MAERESWKNVGVRIRKLRKENRLTLQQLAQRCALSVNAISLVERGKVAPTVMTLCKIAHALGVSASALFQEICPPDGVICRANEPSQDRFSQIAANPQALGKSDLGSPPNKMTHKVLCICGAVEIIANEQCYQLNPGDSLTFYGDALHHWSNPGQETGIAVMVLTARRSDVQEER